MRTHHRLLARRGVALTIVGALLLGACGGDSDTTNDSTTTSTGSSDTTTTSAASSVPSGPIVFKRLLPAMSEGETAIFTANVDGSDVREVVPAPAELPRWSPDGTAISFFCCDDGNAVHILDVETGEVRHLGQPDPTLELFCGFAWTPDSERLACEGYGVDDPSLNGVYTIRASDGDGVTRITSAPGGGADTPGDFSPDGSGLVFMRFKDDKPVGLFVTNVDGSDLRQVPTADLVLDDSGHGGRWSPSGDRILFVARGGAELHKAIWVVDAAGGEPQQLPIAPTCGGPFEAGEHGCYAPSWSPDGTQIVFTRSDDVADAGIYVVNADGSGIQQVTEAEDDQPSWGPPTTG